MDNLSKKGIMMLTLLLKDPILYRNIILDGEVVTSFSIRPDGSIETARGSCLWWSRLCGDTKTISFTDLTIKLINILIGTENNINVAILEGLEKEFANVNFRRNHSKDWFIDTLFDVYRHGYDGLYSSEYIRFDNSPKKKSNGLNNSNYGVRIHLGGDIVTLPIIMLD